MINKEKLLQELCNLYKDIGGPFPYEDLRKMRKTKKFASHFENLGDDDWLSADLNTYFMTVHGLASRILEGHMKEAPTTALQWLTTGDFLPFSQNITSLKMSGNTFRNLPPCMKTQKECKK